MSQDRELFSDRMLEGEYTTWTNLWAIDAGALFGMFWIKTHVDNEGLVYGTTTVFGGNGLMIDRLGNTTFLPGWKVFGGWGPAAKSAAGKYVLIIDQALTDLIIRVYRRGVSIFEFDLSALDPLLTDIWDLSMSPDGRYIAGNANDGGGLELVFLFEGSR